MRSCATMCLLVAWSTSLSIANTAAVDRCVAPPGPAGKFGVAEIILLKLPGCEKCGEPSPEQSHNEKQLRLVLRGGSDGVLETAVEGKDTNEWRHFREDSILDYSVRDPDEDSHASALGWADGAEDLLPNDPTVMPFVAKRERLDTPEKNFSWWMKDFLAENTEYEIPEEPPFKGEQWVTELEKVFNRLHNEWEISQLNGSTAQLDGPYHPRAGSFHKNPALDLTTSGVMDRSWDTARLSHYARLKAELQPQLGAKWKERADEDEVEDDYSSVETPIAAMPTLDDAQKSKMLPGQKYEPAYAAFRNYGEDDWGFSLAINGSMDANTDPWFRVNPDGWETGTDPFQGDWVEKSLEEHFQKQLALFNRNCREQVSYSERAHLPPASEVASDVAEEERAFKDNFVQTASVSYKHRQRTCPFASNKWVNNIGNMPDRNEWNPETPIAQMSLWASSPPSFNDLTGKPRLQGIDGAANDGSDTGGWREPGGDHLVNVQPEPEGAEEQYDY